VTPRFRPFDRARDEAALIDLLCGATWTYRVKVTLTEAEVREEIERGHYTNDDVLTFLIEVGDELAGYARADELGWERSDPQLDFRLAERFRGRGIGQVALEFMTREIFERYAQTRRIEGQTRRDNIAMRKVFTRGGYVMEAVYRRAWPTSGEYQDGIGYAILRSDWEAGATTPVDWDEP
jgi:RimJ/RimL family protein N-acetyltransferase